MKIGILPRTTVPLRMAKIIEKASGIFTNNATMSRIAKTIHMAKSISVEFFIVIFLYKRDGVVSHPSKSNYAVAVFSSDHTFVFPIQMDFIEKLPIVIDLILKSPIVIIPEYTLLHFSFLC